ncbi:MAG: dihydrodipicolinate synthase family protein [Candidatus Acidiferrales bacterium]
MKLHGIFAPFTIPFSADGSVDHVSLRTNVERYNRTPLHGYVLNGSTGESVLLRWDEIYQIWETAKSVAVPGKVLIAGTGAESTPETIAHTARAAALGYDYALVRTPSYFKPLMTVEAEAEHFLRVADSSKIPILLYSIPIFTGYAVEAPLVARVVHHPNIAGLKDSSGNVGRMAEIIAAGGPRFNVLVGSAATLEPSLEKGATGAILALASALPELCCELFAAHNSGDHARAKLIHEKLRIPSEVLVSKNGIPGLKYALDLLGFVGGPPRAPLLPVGNAVKKDIEDVVVTLAALDAANA